MQIKIINPNNSTYLNSFVFLVSNGNIPIGKFQYITWFIELCLSITKGTNLLDVYTTLIQMLHTMVHRVCYKNITVHGCADASRITEISRSSPTFTNLVKHFVWSDRCKSNEQTQDKMCVMSSKLI